MNDIAEGPPALAIHTIHDSIGKSKEDDPKEEASKATQQILESKRRLLRLKHRTDQEVTAVRTAADQQESQHRANEERARQVGMWLPLVS